MSALASSSRARIATPTLRAVRGMAGVNPHTAQSSDVRIDIIRNVLYPADSVAPRNSSPIGARRYQYEERLRAVIPSNEAHETIERAWQLFKREKREKRQRAIAAKYRAMEDACNELDALTGGVDAGGEVPRHLYTRAMQRINHGPAAYAAALQGIKQGKKKTPESRFLETRVEGLVPREAWVPVDSRGKGWNYDWVRPLNVQQ